MTKYVVGDLCNCLNSDDWQDYCISEQLPEGAYSFRTFTGDGTYFDDDGFGYGIDSGTIGILPLDKVSDMDKLRTALKYKIVQVVDLDESEINDETCYDDDNFIHFGPININMGLD